MSSLAKLPDLAGFFSYSRRDDEDSDRSLSDLRRQIHRELRTQLGRELKLWQDTEAIPGGTEWEREIKQAIARSVFFIPIVTPSSVASSQCRLEFDAFLAREGALGRDNLIFPLLYVRVPALESEELWREDPVLAVIGRRQYFDWKKFRHRSFTEAETKETIEQFCRDIVESLRQPWVSPEERRAAKQAEAQRAAEQARRDQEEKAKARRKVEQERLAAEEAKAQRATEQARRDNEERIARERRAANEAEALRIADEARRLIMQERQSSRGSGLISKVAILAGALLFVAFWVVEFYSYLKR
jgi:flagellar biosynthesis GTPase FlhF